MDEARFRQLRAKLLEAGVAARYARRATVELEAHYQQLVEDALRRGESPDAARTEALRLIGTDEVIMERFTASPELRGLPRRWPRFTFAFLPFVSIVVLAIMFAAGLIALSEMGVGTNPRVQQTFFAVRGGLLWVLPVVLSGLFAILAHRHRMPLRWPVLATVVICAIVALINVDLVLNPPGGEPGGQLNIGLGVSVEALPGVMLRAILTSAAVIVPLLLASRTSPSGRP